MAKSQKDLAAEALAAMTGGAPAPEPADAEFDQQDETLAAPAPDASVFAPRQRTTDLIAQRQLDAYRTAIPILLTLGILFPAIGSLPWLAPEGSPFADWGLWVSIVLFAAGAGLLSVAALNMIHVRNKRRAENARIGHFAR
jgi:hypothetical protein